MNRRPLSRSTVPAAHPPKRQAEPRKPKRVASSRIPARESHPPAPKPARPKAVIARIVDDSERSLVDAIDNLLNQGVMLNADIILALANVDLVYLRLSALLCAADRVLPARAR